MRLRFDQTRNGGRRSGGHGHIPENDLVFGAVGRLAPIKSFDKVIELFRRFYLVKETQDRVVGHWCAGTGRTSCANSADQSGVANRIKFPHSTRCTVASIQRNGCVSNDKSE